MLGAGPSLFASQEAHLDVPSSRPIKGGALIYWISTIDRLTLLAPNFRRHLSSAFFILTNYRLCKVERLDVKQHRSR